MGEILDILSDALWDSLRVFPFLFLMYVLIELLERRTAVTRQSNVLRGGLAPLLGAATGIIPQCGFSVMAAKLYEPPPHPHGHPFVRVLSRRATRRSCSF